MGNCFQKRRNGVIKSSLSARPLAFGGVWGTPEGGSPRITSHPLPTPPHQVSTYNAQSPRCEGEMIFSPHLKSFRFDDLKSATRNFRLDYLLGEGGFGYVYKGWLDKGTLAPAKPGNGIVVAVKKLKSEGFQGHKEWLSEVTYLGHLHHPNLVKLIGFCSEGENRLLVYEYMPGGSLENHLFRRGAHPLPWALRIKVAIEAARGLSFLHCLESQVIYRDFKSSNVLLDMDYNAKLSDFGLAKAGPTGDLTHVTTQVMGTQGYTAPEYVATGRLTAKCDVYSFGIVLLELITGRRALDKKMAGSEQKLLEWVKPQLCDAKKLFRIMDSKLEGQYPRKGAYIVANLALQCAHLEARYRPQMSDILSILEKLPIMPNAIPSSISNPQNRELDHHHPKKKPKNHCHHHRHHSHGHHHHPLVNWSPQGSPLMPHRCLSSHVKTLQGQ